MNDIYDLTAEVGEDGLLHCSVSYMPYRTGGFPADFQGAEVSSLRELLQAAREGLGQESVSVRITDPALKVDDMNRALQQVGGSYLLCQLNRDGTAVTVAPQGGLSREEALARLEEINGLVEQVYSRVITPGMDQREQAQALYTYLTERVGYDFRYYSQPEEMPYDSMTAYGALHDGLAICGGYAQALQALFERAGIPCITVSGTMGSEYHMWVLARLDGQWLYFDPTSDRGRANYGFLYFAVKEDGLARYTWEQEWVEQLAQDLYPCGPVR